MDYSARQKKFQQTLHAERLDGFVVTHPANLRYLCGYTGSNGLLLFLNGRTTFFTDGRYTLQAREEVKGARIVIAKGALIKDAAAMLGKPRSAGIGFEADLTTRRRSRPDARAYAEAHSLEADVRADHAAAHHQRRGRAEADQGGGEARRKGVSRSAGVAESRRFRSGGCGEAGVRRAPGRSGCDVVRHDRRRRQAWSPAAWARVECCRSRGADSWSSIPVLYCAITAPT